MPDDDKLVKVEVIPTEEGAFKRALAEKIALKMVGTGRDACVYATHTEALMQRGTKELFDLWHEHTGPRPTYRVEAVMPKIVLETKQLQDPPSFTRALAAKLNELDAEGYDLTETKVIGQALILIAKDKEKR